MSGGPEHVDDMTAEPPGRSRYGDLRLLHDCLPVMVPAAVLNAHKMRAARSM